MHTRAECFVCVKDLSLQECTRYSIAKIIAVVSTFHLHGFVLLWYMIPSIFSSLNLSLDLQVYGTKFRIISTMFLIILDLEYVNGFSMYIHWCQRFQSISKILISFLFYRNKVVSLVSSQLLESRD